MLTKLRRKFIIIIMLLASVLLTIILCSICFYLYHNLISEMNQSLKAAIEYVISKESQSGSLNKRQAGAKTDTNEKTAEKQRELDMSYLSICVIRYDMKTDEVTVKLDQLQIKEEILQTAASIVWQSKRHDGSIEEYNLFYYRAEDEDGMLIALTEKNYVMSELAEYGGMLLFVEACALLIIFFISLIVPQLAIQPIQKAMEEQKRFIADASHELKTPLSVILANNSILRSQKEKSVEEQMMWMDSTDKEIKQMSGLIHDMLLLAKSESGFLEKQFMPVDFSKIVMRCTLQFEAVAYERNITIKERIQEGIYVSGNEILLNQLVMSLVDNAVKYEAENGWITVTFHRKRDKAELIVHNSITVIPKEALSHIFERFYSIDHKKRGNNSFGLGLSIAKSIAERHGGTILAKSNANEGTTFQVNLRTVSVKK